MPSRPSGSLTRPASANDNFNRLLDTAGIGKNSQIRVTGPAGLPALLWFCRHGFDKVGYIRGEVCASEDGDLLVVPMTCDARTLSDMLRRGPRPREGGVLIVQTPECHPADGATDPIHDLLRRAGYAVERCLHGERRELHVARREFGKGASSLH